MEKTVEITIADVAINEEVKLRTYLEDLGLPRNIEGKKLKFIVEDESKTYYVIATVTECEIFNNYLRIHLATKTGHLKYLDHSLPIDPDVPGNDWQVAAEINSENPRTKNTDIVSKGFFHIPMPTVNVYLDAREVLLA